MTRKQLAEMIKSLRKKSALKEVIGKPGPFDPEHHKPTHPEDETSSNQYAHSVKKEEVLNELGGTYHKRKLNVFYQNKIASKRRKWQVETGQQKMRGRYTEEEVEKLGSTDTGEKMKSKQDEVDVNPKITSATGETTKNNNTTIKERKEK